MYGCGEKPRPMTITYVDPMSHGGPLRVYWGAINGDPVYMLFGTRAVTVTVSSEWLWLKANPTKPGN